MDKSDRDSVGEDASVCLWQINAHLGHKVLQDYSKNLSQKGRGTSQPTELKRTDDKTDSRSIGKHDYRLQMLDHLWERCKQPSSHEYGVKGEHPLHKELTPTFSRIRHVATKWQ